MTKVKFSVRIFFLPTQRYTSGWFLAFWGLPTNVSLARNDDLTDPLSEKSYRHPLLLPPYEVTRFSQNAKTLAIITDMPRQSHYASLMKLADGTNTFQFIRYTHEFCHSKLRPIYATYKLALIPCPRAILPVWVSGIELLSWELKLVTHGYHHEHVDWQDLDYFRFYTKSHLEIWKHSYIQRIFSRVTNRPEISVLS